jgi:hypothetical protein
MKAMLVLARGLFISSSKSQITNRTQGLENSRAQNGTGGRLPLIGVAAPPASGRAEPRATASSSSGLSVERSVLRLALLYVGVIP